MTSVRGHGYGLRVRHYGEFLESGIHHVEFVEAITENFMRRGARPRAVLERVRRDVPVVLHGVSMSIGSTDPLSKDYLIALKHLADEIEAPWVSDHLCFGSLGGHYGHDLWPIPFTKEAIQHLSCRIDCAQSLLQREIIFENISSYIEFQSSEMNEWEFLSEVIHKTGCKLLLDINNIYVNSFNFSFNPVNFIQSIPQDCVRQYHVAGHLHRGNYLFDNHQGPTPDAIWNLYKVAVQRFGNHPCIVEWDENVPELSVLETEVARARSIAMEASVS